MHILYISASQSFRRVRLRSLARHLSYSNLLSADLRFHMLHFLRLTAEFRSFFGTGIAEQWLQSRSSQPGAVVSHPLTRPS